MSYIPFEAGLLSYLGYGIIALGAISFLTIVILSLKQKITIAYGIVSFGIAFIGAIFLQMEVSGIGKGIPTVQERSAADAIEAVYGIELNDEKIEALDYPRDEPTADFAAFGSFEHMLPDGDGGYELNRVFLIWEDGEMKLANSTDGESFAPLATESN